MWFSFNIFLDLHQLHFTHLPEVRNLKNKCISTIWFIALYNENYLETQKDQNLCLTNSSPLNQIDRKQLKNYFLWIIKPYIYDLTYKKGLNPPIYQSITLTDVQSFHLLQITFTFKISTRMLKNCRLCQKIWKVCISFLFSLEFMWY